MARKSSFTTALRFDDEASVAITLENHVPDGPPPARYAGYFGRDSDAAAKDEADRRRSAAEDEEQDLCERLGTVQPAKYETQLDWVPILDMRQVRPRSRWQMLT